MTNRAFHAMNPKQYTLLLLVILLVGCATYYQKNLRFQEYFAEGEIEKANGLLEKDDKTPKGKNKLLYFLDRGVLFRMLGDFTSSNTYFEKAETVTQDYQKNYGKVLLSYLTNPMMLPYKGEDF